MICLLCLITILKILKKRDRPPCFSVETNQKLIAFFRFSVIAELVNSSQLAAAKQSMAQAAGKKEGKENAEINQCKKECKESESFFQANSLKPFDGSSSMIFWLQKPKFLK